MERNDEWQQMMEEREQMIEEAFERAQAGTANCTKAYCMLCLLETNGLYQINYGRKSVLKWPRPRGVGLVRR